MKIKKLNNLKTRSTSFRCGFVLHRQKVKLICDSQKFLRQKKTSRWKIPISKTMSTMTLPEKKLFVKLQDLYTVRNNHQRSLVFSLIFFTFSLIVNVSSRINDRVLKNQQISLVFLLT